MPHREIEPASAACRSDAVPPELLPLTISVWYLSAHYLVWRLCICCCFFLSFFFQVGLQFAQLVASVCYFIRRICFTACSPFFLSVSFLQRLFSLSAEFTDYGVSIDFQAVSPSLSARPFPAISASNEHRHRASHTRLCQPTRRGQAHEKAYSGSLIHQRHSAHNPLPTPPPTSLRPSGVAG